MIFSRLFFVLNSNLMVCLLATCSLLWKTGKNADSHWASRRWRKSVNPSWAWGVRGQLYYVRCPVVWLPLRKSTGSARRTVRKKWRRWSVPTAAAGRKTGSTFNFRSRYGAIRERKPYCSRTLFIRWKCTSSNCVINNATFHVWKFLSLNLGKGTFQLFQKEETTDSRELVNG